MNFFQKQLMNLAKHSSWQRPMLLVAFALINSGCPKIQIPNFGSHTVDGVEISDSSTAALAALGLNGAIAIDLGPLQPVNSSDFYCPYSTSCAIAGRVYDPSQAMNDYLANNPALQTQMTNPASAALQAMVQFTTADTGDVISLTLGDLQSASVSRNAVIVWTQGNLVKRTVVSSVITQVNYKVGLIPPLVSTGSYSFVFFGGSEVASGYASGKLTFVTPHATQSVGVTTIKTLPGSGVVQAPNNDPAFGRVIQNFISQAGVSSTYLNWPMFGRRSVALPYPVGGVDALYVYNPSSTWSEVAIPVPLPSSTATPNRSVMLCAIAQSEFMDPSAACPNSAVNGLLTFGPSPASSATQTITINAGSAGLARIALPTVNGVSFPSYCGQVVAGGTCVQGNDYSTAGVSSCTFVVQRTNNSGCSGWLSVKYHPKPLVNISNVTTIDKQIIFPAATSGSPSPTPTLTLTGPSSSASAPLALSPTNHVFTLAAANTSAATITAINKPACLSIGGSCAVNQSYAVGATQSCTIIASTSSSLCNGPLSVTYNTSSTSNAIATFFPSSPTGVELTSQYGFDDLTYNQSYTFVLKNAGTTSAVITGLSSPISCFTIASFGSNSTTCANNGTLVPNATCNIVVTGVMYQHPTYGQTKCIAALNVSLGSITVLKPVTFQDPPGTTLTRFKMYIPFLVPGFVSVAQSDLTNMNIGAATGAQNLGTFMQKCVNNSNTGSFIGGPYPVSVANIGTIGANNMNARIKCCLEKWNNTWLDKAAAQSACAILPPYQYEAVSSGVDGATSLPPAI